MCSNQMIAECHHRACHIDPTVDQQYFLIRTRVLSTITSLPLKIHSNCENGFSHIRTCAHFVSSLKNTMDESDKNEGYEVEAKPPAWTQTQLSSWGASSRYWGPSSGGILLPLPLRCPTPFRNVGDWTHQWWQLLCRREESKEKRNNGSALSWVHSGTFHLR